MKRLLCYCVFPLLLAAVVPAGLTAQSPEPTRGRGMRQQMNPMEAGMLGMRELRLAARLGLTTEQQATISAAFAEAATFRRDMVSKATELRTQLDVAVRANNEASIDSTSRELADLLQKQIAFQARTVAKVYGTLTAEQKAKLAEDVKRSLGVMGPSGRRMQGRQ